MTDLRRRMTAEERALWLIEGHEMAHGLTDRFELLRRIVSQIEEAERAAYRAGFEKAREMAVKLAKKHCLAESEDKCKCPAKEIRALRCPGEENA